jgi:hypothetical protein
MSEGPINRQRWFRFSLRTVALSLAAFGLWLGWNVRVVHERNAMRYEIRKNGGYVLLVHSLESPLDANDNEVIGNQMFDVVGDNVPLSPLRRLLGDEPVVMIGVKRPDEIQRAKKIFPECAVQINAEWDGTINLTFPPDYPQPISDNLILD